MQTGLRLYQAIIDQSQALGIDFDAAAHSCGVSADLLMSCFDEPTHTKPHDLYDVLTRRRIDAISSFLDCSGFRVFLLADVFKWEDYSLISGSGLFAGPSTADVTRANEAALYLHSVVSADVFGSPEFIVGEFIAATWSKTLAEACTKVAVSYRKLLAWKNGVVTPELSDIEEIKLMAAAMEVGTPMVMGGLGLLKYEDFLLHGTRIDIEHELNAALEVEIW
ncbi:MULTISPECIES: XRE family transcriptional regulator [unclassified Cupriavidus]|uniref:XRE family transcriptional regulator n=1 Tax=unclassified Cupriavidus TaxID=2640874 RepID=UPI0010F781B1|nr:MULTISPECIES: XRE family transcriptional regulator [unclassified Cupriavidus]QWE97984.1 XRE family transcriptional regulator [Cupriavidus sp. EM10]